MATKPGDLESRLLTYKIKSRMAKNDDYIRGRLKAIWEAEVNMQSPGSPRATIAAYYFCAYLRRFEDRQSIELRKAVSGDTIKAISDEKSTNQIPSETLKKLSELAN